MPEWITPVDILDIPIGAPRTRQNPAQQPPSSPLHLTSRPFHGFLPYLVYESRRKGGDLTFQQLAIRFRFWDRHFQKAWKRIRSPRPLRISNSETGMRRLKKLLQLNSVQEMREFWQSKPRRKRDLDWPHIMSTALNFYPERAAQVLEATVETGVTPKYAVCDTLAFLAMWSSKLPDDRRAEHEAVLPGLLLHILDTSPRGYYQFRQWTLFRIIAACGPDTLAEIYTKLERHKHLLHLNTRLQIAGRLAQHVRYKLTALEILEKMARVDKIDINAPRYAALSTSIMTFPGPDPSGHIAQSLPEPMSVPEMQSELYERLLRLVLTPNLIQYTAMIRNLCSNKQLRTAWKIYDIMCEQGFTLDPHVYSTLLNGSKHAGSLKGISHVINDASPEALREPYVWNDLLHTAIVAAQCEFGSSPRRVAPAFPSMLDVYAKFFRLEPLQNLLQFDLRAYLADPRVSHYSGPWSWMARLQPVLDRLPVSEPHELVEPGSDTLGIMLIGYLRSCHSVSNIIAFYSHFRALLRVGDPVARNLMRTSTVVYDAVIKAVTEHEGTLRVAIDILADMLRDAAASAAALAAAAAGPSQAITTPATPNHQAFEKQDDSSPSSFFLHPPPSVHTWSILLHAFTRHDHARQGERVLRMMRAHGVEPNLVTWNTLVAGHARHTGRDDRGDAVLRALHGLDEAGFRPDERTIQALTGLLSRNDRVLDTVEEWMERRRVAALEAAAERAREEKKEEKRRRRLLLAEKKADRRRNGAARRAGVRTKGPEAEAKKGKQTAAQPTEEFMAMYDELVFMKMSDELKEIKDEMATLPQPARGNVPTRPNPRQRQAQHSPPTAIRSMQK